MADYGVVRPFPAERARAPKPKLDVFRPFFVAQMEGREPAKREWLVDGVLLRRTVMLFAGPPKIGKSLLLQQMLTAISLGQPWLNRETVQARTFGLFCEDPQDELERRQADINLFYDRGPADFETEYSWDSRDGRDALLVEFERFNEKPKWTDLWAQLVDFVKDEGIRVIGLDTAATIFGGNENFRSQTTQFLRALQKLAVEIDGSIILNAHPSRSSPNSHSGSTAWLASVRSGISLGRPVDYDEETRQPANVRVLRGLGSNYGGGITAERLEYDHGVFVPAEPDHASGGGKRAPLSTIERGELRYRLLIGLKRILQKGVKIPADVMKRGSMPDRAKTTTDPQLNRVSLNDLYQAQEELIEEGRIVLVEVNKQVLIRPADGPYYEGENPYLPIAVAPAKSELPNAAD